MPRFAANLSFLYPELPFLDRIDAAGAVRQLRDFLFVVQVGLLRAELNQGVGQGVFERAVKVPGAQRLDERRRGRGVTDQSQRLGGHAPGHLNRRLCELE